MLAILTKQRIRQTRINELLTATKVAVVKETSITL